MNRSQEGGTLGSRFYFLFIILFSLAVQAQEAPVNESQVDLSAAQPAESLPDHSRDIGNNGGLEYGDVFAGRKQRSKFASSFFQLGSFQMDSMHRGEAGYSTYNYIGLSYRLEKGQAIAFKPVFYMDTTGKNYRGDFVKSNVQLGDAYFEWTKSHLALLPGDIGVWLAVRGFLPTSQRSKDNENLGSVMTYFIFSRPITSRFQFDYYFKPQAYFQKKTGTYIEGPDLVFGNQMAALDHYLEASYRVAPGWKLTQNVGSEQDWYFPVESEQIRGFRRQSWKYQTGVGCDVTSDFYLLVALQHKRDLDNPKGGFSLFKDDESSYVLLSSLRF